MVVPLFSLLSATAGAQCADRCPTLASTTAAFVDWAAPEDAQPPAIDRRAPAHLRVATFALG